MYHLGTFSFEPPAVESSESSKDQSAACDSASSSVTEEVPSSGKTVDQPEEKTWLYECYHHGEDYLCFPPYCAPGGLRSRLFAAGAFSRESDSGSEDITCHSSNNIQKKAEELVHQHSLFRYNNLSFPLSNNPLDLILGNQYVSLPHFVKQILIDTQHDWDTLGGSRCSYNKHLGVVEKHKSSPAKVVEPASHPSIHQNQPQQKGEHSINVATNFNHSIKGLGAAALRFASVAITAPLLSENYIEKALAKEPGYLESNPTIESPTIHRATPKTKYHIMPPAQHDDFPADIHDHERCSSGKPIPDAVLVYHESAHSIVFRDHLRRQLRAIKRTTTDMETSAHSTQAVSAIEASRHSSVHSTDGIVEVCSTDNSERGYRPSDSSDVDYESAGSRESHSNLDKTQRGKNLLRKGEKKPESALNQVAVANFQPVIEPLERLELNAIDMFQPLLDTNPMVDIESNELSTSLGLTEAEIEGEIHFDCDCSHTIAMRWSN